MAPFELLDPYYDKDHRGLFIAQGKVTTLLLLITFVCISICVH